MVDSGLDYHFQSGERLWSLEGSVAPPTLAPYPNFLSLSPFQDSDLPQQILGTLN